MWMGGLVNIVDGFQRLLRSPTALVGRPVLEVLSDEEAE